MPRYTRQTLAGRHPSMLLKRVESTPSESRTPERLSELGSGRPSRGRNRDPKPVQRIRHRTGQKTSRVIPVYLVQRPLVQAHSVFLLPFQGTGQTLCLFGFVAPSPQPFADTLRVDRL